MAGMADDAGNAGCMAGAWRKGAWVGELAQVAAVRGSPDRRTRCPDRAFQARFSSPLPCRWRGGSGRQMRRVGPCQRYRGLIGPIVLVLWEKNPEST